MKKIIILIFIFLITGCYNYNELNDLAITSAFAIDYDKDKDEFIITTQVINTQKNSSDSTSNSNTTKFTTYTSSHNNIQTAIRKLNIKTSKKIYAEHTILLVINESVATKNLDDIFDFMLRSNQSHKQYTTLIIKNTQSAEALKIITPLTGLNAKSIVSTIRNDQLIYGSTFNLTFEELVNDYINPRKTIIIPTIELVGNPQMYGDNIKNIEESDPQNYLKSSGLAIFKNNKLDYYLNNEESIILNILNNKANTIIYSVIIDKENFFVVDIKNIKTKIKFTDNKFNIEITGSANIDQIDGKLNTNTNKSISNLNKFLNESIKRDVIDLLNKSIEYNNDILSINNYLYKHHNKYYKTISDFDTYYKNISFNVNSKINIETKGNILRSLNSEE